MTTTSADAGADGMTEIPARLALLVRRALANAASGGSRVNESGWRRERDRLGDLLEPVTPSSVSTTDLRRMIDVLAESAPSTGSRMSADEWRHELDGVIDQLSALS